MSGPHGFPVSLILPRSPFDLGALPPRVGLAQGSFQMSGKAFCANHLRRAQWMEFREFRRSLCYAWAIHAMAGFMMNPTSFGTTSAKCLRMPFLPFDVAATIRDSTGPG